MKVDILENWKDVAALGPVWNSLLARSKANSIFLTWEWISAWLESGGKSRVPFVISVRDSGGDLIGIAPFYLATFRFGGIIPYRTLRVAADYATGADYPDWIMKADHESEIRRAIVAELLRAQSHWDCLWMPSVAGWTGATERILGACEPEAFHFRSRPRDFGVVTLPDTVDAYFRSLSSNKRQQLRGEIKRISRQPNVTMTRCETADEIPRYLDALFELHYRRWQTRGEEGSFRRKPQLMAFYRHFVPRALANGWLWLNALMDHNEYKAVQLGYVYERTFYQIQEGFDPQYMKGVGNVLRAHVIEACIAEGIRTVDFLGEMSEHKRRWLAIQRDGYDLFLGPRKLKNYPLFSAEIWPTGRFLCQTD